MRIPSKFIIGLFGMIPGTIGILPHIQPSAPLIIQKQESSPPFIALKSIQAAKDKSKRSKEFGASSVELSTESVVSTSEADSTYQTAQLLDVMVIRAEERSYREEKQIADLTPKQAERLEIAQQESKVLNQDWSIPTYDDYAQQILKEAGVSVANSSKKNSDPAVSEGEIELSQGLALSDSNSLEFHYSEEEASKDQAGVDIYNGRYFLKTGQPGSLVTVVVKDKRGQIVGEGRSVSSPDQKGKKVVLSPSTDLSGVIASSGKPSGNTHPTTVSAIDEEAQTTVAADGSYQLAGLSRDSTAILVASRKEFLNSLVVAGTSGRTKIQMFPKSMIQDLKDIVTDQLKMSVDFSDSSVVWGTVKQAGRPVSGVQITPEGANDAIVVYFNAFNLPDIKLTETTENGIYAILKTPSGFQNLIAKKAGKLFSFDNIYVEANGVSLPDLEVGLESYVAPLRTYDAFSGNPIQASVDLQNREERLEIGPSGFAQVQLENKSKLTRAYLYAAEEYERAQYIFNQADGKIYLPAIPSSWLRQLRSFKKIDDLPSSGTIVVFTPHQAIHFGQGTIYFDSQGMPSETPRQGGGAVLFNQEAGAQELHFREERNNTFGSRLVPVDAGGTTVINLREI